MKANKKPAGKLKYYANRIAEVVVFEGTKKEKTLRFAALTITDALESLACCWGVSVDSAEASVKSVKLCEPIGVYVSVYKDEV